LSWSHLEEKIAEYFSSLGYKVTRNLRLRGKSGALHEIDVYAEKEGPEGKISIIIEAKDYSEPVAKEWVMKLAEIKEDIGADKAILVTSSRFTPAAIAIAQSKGIDLWDNETFTEKIKITRLSKEKIMIRIIPPLLEKDEALKIVSKNLRKMLFFKSEKIKNFILIFHPVYLVEVKIIELVSSLLGKTIKRYLKRYLIIDSVNSYILGSYKINNQYIDLDNPLIKVIASLTSKGEIKLNDIETIINKELVKNMIDQHILSYDSKRNTLKIVPKTSRILIDPNLIEKKITTTNENKLLTESSKIDINSLTKKLENIGFDIISIGTVFYPFYKADIIDKDGGERYIYVDGITKRVLTIP
jgi:hypothetical protein